VFRKSSSTDFADEVDVNKFAVNKFVAREFISRKLIPRKSLTSTTLPKSKSNVEHLDQWMRHILFISLSQRTNTHYKRTNVFGLALFLSATRCILQYVVFPFILPFLGLIGNIPVWLSLSLSGIAFVSLFTSLRRFWKANHPRRFAYLPLALLMSVVLIVFVLSDLEIVHF
jgi:hypothetical protein